MNKLLINLLRCYHVKMTTSLQQKRVYTSLGSSCPQCVHQSCEEYQRIVLVNMSKPYIQAHTDYYQVIIVSIPALSWTLVYACWSGRT